MEVSSVGGNLVGYFRAQSQKQKVDAATASWDEGPVRGEEKRSWYFLSTTPHDPLYVSM